MRDQTASGLPKKKATFGSADAICQPARMTSTIAICQTRSESRDEGLIAFQIMAQARFCWA